MKLVPSFSIEKTSIAAQLRCMRIEKLGSSNEKLWQNYEKIRDVTQQWDDICCWLYPVHNTKWDTTLQQI